MVRPVIIGSPLRPTSPHAADGSSAASAAAWRKRKRFFYSALMLMGAAAVLHSQEPPPIVSSKNKQGDIVLAVDDSPEPKSKSQSKSKQKPSSTSMSQPVGNFSKFGFYVMGDTPYSIWEESLLKAQIDNITKHHLDHALFTVHVGDIQKVARTNCEPTHYKKIQRLLRRNSLPTVLLPGDNDWYDCPSQLESFRVFQEHFNGMEDYWEDRWPKRTPHFRRWKEHPEYFVMQHEGILFVSIHLIHGDPANEPEGVFDTRVRRSIDWVNKNVEDYFTRYPSIRGVILLGHSLRSPWTRPFFEGIAGNFVNSTSRVDTPVLYLHGDGHKWSVDTKFAHQLNWKYYTDVQVDQGGMAHPCIVEIAPQVNGKTQPLTKEHDNQHLFGKGLFRIDRQRGRYTSDELAQHGAPSGVLKEVNDAAARRTR